MTRAEEAAFKTYPPKIGTAYDAIGIEYETDVNARERLGFQRGYEQAEKDLALTWVDIKTIDLMIAEVDMGLSDDRDSTVPDQKFYGEVLKRFNETR